MVLELADKPKLSFPFNYLPTNFFNSANIDLAKVNTYYAPC